MERGPRGSRREAFRDALGAFALSRALVWGVAVVAALVLPVAEERGDEPYQREVAQPFGEPLDSLFGPLARWDAISYLGIADDGYEGPERRVAFFPLYPLTVRAGAAFSGSETVHLLVAYLVSAAAFLGALYLLHRLVDLARTGDRARDRPARGVFSPWSFFFSAPYTESLFLLLSIGAFYAARTDRWALAGVCLALLSATRNTGILVAVPVALLYLWPRRRLAWDAAWLLLAPLGLVAYCLHLNAVRGDPLAWVDAQEAEEFDRSLEGPFVGLWEALRAGIEAPWHLAAGGGPRDGVFYDTLPLILLVLACFAVVWLVRRLHPAYGVYVGLALIPAVSAPNDEIPLLSLPRFLTVLFPLFMVLAVVSERRGLTNPLIAGMAALLACLTAVHATWHFVA